MTTHPGRLPFLALLFTLLALLPLAPALGQTGFSAPGATGFPTPAENYINDFANVLQPADAQILRAQLKALEEQTGIEGTVVTINAMADYQTGAASFEAFATGLFNAWGVGNKRDNKGFMLLLAVKDRKCRIELGDGYGSQYSARMKEIIDQTMTPRFASGEYSRGLHDGTIAVIDSVSRKVSWFQYYRWHLVGFAVVILCVIAGISCLRHGKTGWGFAFFALAIAILVWILSILGRSKGSSRSFGGGRSSGGGASGSW